MRGEGLLAGPIGSARPVHGGYPDAETAVPSELADFIAYLERRRDNAAAMAKQKPALCEWAHDRMTQLDAILNDFSAGLHIGQAEVRSALLAKQADLA